MLMQSWSCRRTGKLRSQGPAALRCDVLWCSVLQAVYRCIMAASAGRPELTARLAAGLLLVGPGGGLRGLGSMMERRVGQHFAAAKQPQVRWCLIRRVCVGVLSQS